MELSDMHNPTCKLHASQSLEDDSPVRERKTSDVSDIFLSPEAYKATQSLFLFASIPNFSFLGCLEVELLVSGGLTLFWGGGAFFLYFF